MRRRRLIVIVGVLALIVAGAEWWVISPALSADERSLVGAWRSQSPGDSGGQLVEFRADRTCAWETFSDGPEHYFTMSAEIARWSLRGDRLILDYESSVGRRVLRPIASRIGVATRPVASVRLSFVTPDEIAVTDPYSRGVYARAPAN